MSLGESEGPLNLQYLDLTDCVRLMDAGLHLIAKNSPHLRQLYLRRCINITGTKFSPINTICIVIENKRTKAVKSRVFFIVVIIGFSLGLK